MQNLPMKMNRPPSPPTSANRMLLAQIVSKACFAAKQKLFPVKATIMYALLFKNLMNRSKHSIKQLKHLRMHFVHLFSLPATFSVW